MCTIQFFSKSSSKDMSTRWWWWWWWGLPVRQNTNYIEVLKYDIYTPFNIINVPPLVSYSGPIHTSPTAIFNGNDVCNNKTMSYSLAAARTPSSSGENGGSGRMR